MPVFKKKKAEKAPPLPDPCDGPVKTLDKRVGMDTYRDFFTLKNFWKTVRRNQQQCGKTMFAQFLKSNPGNRPRYAKLKNAPEVITSDCADSGFETLAAQYLKVFDDVITSLEENSEDATDAINCLTKIGKMHKSKAGDLQPDDFRQMEEPFLKMVSDVLDDRYNEKAEKLFRTFFQFCLKYIQEGLSS
ncbi:GLOBIN domain-containing protein [Aphelenchoides fujianensis]|nr:GLOBIN domain-containing protein [Aphelenchoides fujianensis]